MAHQKRVLTTEEEELDLGARGDTVPGAEKVMMEFVDTELSAELGAGEEPDCVITDTCDTWTGSHPGSDHDDELSPEIGSLGGEC